MMRHKDSQGGSDRERGIIGSRCPSQQGASDWSGSQGGLDALADGQTVHLLLTRG